jgi:hypothetical protein
MTRDGVVEVPGKAPARVDCELLLDLAAELLVQAGGDVDLAETAVRVAAAPGEWAALRARLARMPGGA